MDPNQLSCSRFRSLPDDLTTESTRGRNNNEASSLSPKQLASPPPKKKRLN